MPRVAEATQTILLPGLGDMLGVYHFGDGIAGPIITSRIQGYYPGGTAYKDVQVDVNGIVQVSSGGGGGGAVTVADGADVAQGATSDVAWVGAGNGSLVAISKAEYAKLEAIRALLAASLTVTGPLTDAQLRASAVPISAATLPLPTNAATSAKQPALGTAGVAATDVITVQGIASGVAQAVSGTVTANIGSSGSLALDATLTGGTAKAITRGGAKGASAAADVTSTASGANHQPLDVAIYDAAGNLKDPTQVRALTSADVVTAAQGTAAAVANGWPVKLTDGTNTAAVKAASTAAAAADPAAVVSLSPNSPLPTGTNTIGSAKLTDGTNVATVKAGSAAPAATDTALVVVSRDSPSEGTAFASASRAAGTYTFDIADTTGYSGIAIVTDLTVLGASSTVTNTIQVKDPVTAKFASATAAAFTAVSTVSTTRQAAHPANAGASGNLQGGVLTKAVRLSCVVATAASTFSIGYSLTP